MKKTKLVNILLDEQKSKLPLSLLQQHTKHIEIPVGIKSEPFKKVEDPTRQRFSSEKIVYVPMYKIAYLAELLKGTIEHTLSNKMFRDPDDEDTFIRPDQARNLREVAKELEYFVNDLKNTFPKQFER